MLGLGLDKKCHRQSMLPQLKYIYDSIRIRYVTGRRFTAEKGAEVYVVRRVSYPNLIFSMLQSL